jgi:hypothetical protein
VKLVEVISIRVPKDLKEEMSKLDLNWAEYLRGAIEERVRAERMLRACKEMDELRKKTKTTKFDSTKIIRSMRNSR